METSRQVQKISVSDELYQKLKSDVEKQKREKEKEALQGLIARYKEIEADLISIRTNGFRLILMNFVLV